MDSIRAKQIIQSPQSIQVLYEGKPVWLENVKDNNTAVITPLDDRQGSKEVPVYMLIENNPVNK